MIPVPATPEPERNPYRRRGFDASDPACRREVSAWDQGFKAGAAAFDAVVAERDARWQDDNAILQAVIAERDAAITAGQNALHEMSTVAGLLRMQDDKKIVYYGDRLADACHAFRDFLAPGMNEAIAAQDSVSGSSEPR